MKRVATERVHVLYQYHLPVSLIVIRYNLVFFLSGGGKFNYQGTKRWLEENLDNPGIATVWIQD